MVLWPVGFYDVWRRIVLAQAWFAFLFHQNFYQPLTSLFFMALSLVIDNVLVAFALILVLGLFLPEVAQKWRISTVPFYIIAGMLIGPYGFGVLQSHPALSFVGELGLYFLIFIAGLEVYRTTGAKWGEPARMSVFFALVCFFAGFVFGQLMGFGVLSSLLVGTILVSSSVGEIIPIVNASRSLKEKASHLIIPAVVILDTLSLVGISLLTQYQSSPISLLVMASSIVLFFLVGVVLIPRAARWYFSRGDKKKADEGDLKFIIAALFVVVAVSEIIHLHGILAAFLAGLLIGRSVPHRKEFHRLEGIGYALLIPVFFVVLGMETNIRVLWTGGAAAAVAVGLLFTLFTSKLAAGVMFGAAGGFRGSSRERIKKGALTGVIFWPQLSATIAATVVGREFGLVDESLFVAVIIMAIVSATLTPFLIPHLWKEKITPLGLKNHIVLIGAGAMGSMVLEYLLDGDKDFVVVETDMERVRWLREEWIPYIFGPGEDAQVLHNANVDNAGLVVVCIGDDKKSERIVRLVKRINPRCRVIVRVHDASYVKLLAVAESVIRPESLMGDEMNRQIERLHTGL